MLGTAHPVHGPFSFATCRLWLACAIHSGTASPSVRKLAAPEQKLTEFDGSIWLWEGGSCHQLTCQTKNGKHRPCFRQACALQRSNVFFGCSRQRFPCTAADFEKPYSTTVFITFSGVTPATRFRNIICLYCRMLESIQLSAHVCPIENFSVRFFLFRLQARQFAKTCGEI